MSLPITVVIPTYNAGSQFHECAEMLVKQKADIDKVLVIDSSSTDGTAEIAKAYGFAVEGIAKSDFGHGRTRQYALEKTKTEIVVFMTQDALLANEYSIEKLVDYLQSDSNLAAVYGRQLPYPQTGVLGRFARLYNYPEKSFINCFEDRKTKGLKAAFLSDSFAAYKKSLLVKIGGFPKHVNFGEDMYVAAKFLMAGYKTGYCAEAAAYHAHDYSLLEECSRCKLIGRFHSSEKWLLENFGKAEGEGLKYVCCEARYLWKSGKAYLWPMAFLHNVVKFAGYRMGTFL